MSLFKQIGLSISVFLMIVLGTVIFLNFKSSQTFIQDQLYSNAEDTAASLALSLGGVVDSEADTSAEMETMIAAIFDRGYYEAITLYTPEKEIIIQKKQKVVVKDVPQWFIEFAHLDAKAATSDVSGGWTPFGIIEVKNHTGHAYVQLWEIFIGLIQNFVMLGVTFLILLYLLVKIILRSLVDIEKQAKAIQDNDFIIYEKVPFTTEFRHVVKAMNSMVVKVKQIFDKEAQSLQKYHELLYTDTATKLFNRRYLMMRLAALLEEESANGSFVMITLSDMKATNDKLGYVKFEELLGQIAARVQICATKSDDAIAARMKNSDFALLLPKVKLEDIKKDLQFAMHEVVELIKDYGVEKELVVSAGAIGFSPDDTQKTLFARADFELTKAKVRHDNSIEFAKEDAEAGIVLGKEEWVAMINTSMEENMLKVAGQDVVSCKDTQEVMHEEIYLRMMDEQGKVYNAGYFMPVLVNLKLTDDVDKHVISLALHYAQKGLLKNGVAINIAASFLKNAPNLAWLQDQIAAFAKTSKLGLSFEASKFAVSKNVELFSQFSALLKGYGYSFGIDNFSISNEPLEFLQKIKPAYIKASKSFFFDLQNSENSTASDSLSILTKSVGIKMVATAVESLDDIEKLEKMGVDYVQGSAICEPKILGV